MEESFREFAVSYLSRNAHADTRSHYCQLLEDNNRGDLAGLIQNLKPEKSRKALNVFAVDDSKMILNIYRSILNNMDASRRFLNFHPKPSNRSGSKNPI